MSDRPERRFSQIGLATAVVLMCLVSAMSWPFLKIATGVTDLPFAASLPIYAGLLFLMALCGAILLFVISVLEGHISLFLNNDSDMNLLLYGVQMRNPTRRFWQIHLSTAVMLMFVAGGLLWLNFNARFLGNTVIQPSDSRLLTPIEVPAMSQVYVQGFPWNATGYCDIREQRIRTWSNEDLLFDIMVSASILAAIWLFSELIIRYREARKP